MTFIDWIIPYYAWFKFGYADVSLPMAIISVSGVLLTLVTVKGMDVSLGVIVIAVASVVGVCIAYGYISVKYNFQNRVNDYLNRNTNPHVAMIPKMAEDIEKIKKCLEKRNDH